MAEIQGGGPTYAESLAADADNTKSELASQCGDPRASAVALVLEALAKCGARAYDGDVPIVGDPGWVPASPTGKQTTTEVVAALQRRYPDDPEVRALIAKVTDDGAEVVAANDRCGRAIGEANRLFAHRDALASVLRSLDAAGGPEGAGPGLDGIDCKYLADDARRTLAGDEADE
jgi:hypothetical protein